MTRSAKYDVHIVGSVPLPSAGDVFRRLSHELGPALKRMPDGETGERLSWSHWLGAVFLRHEDFFQSGKLYPLTDNPGADPVPKFEMKPGIAPETARFDKLPIAKDAIASYRIFEQLRKAGEIPADCRFQVDLAPAHVIVWRWFRDELHGVLEPLYNKALGVEIQKMLRVIPATDMAIQWDVSSRVFARLEWGEPTRYGATRAEMFDTFATDCINLGGLVPEPVELVYHFCYGDSNHKHNVEPTSMADMVEMANRITHGLQRSIQLIHMPVPRDRTDDAYFAPLATLALRPETRISLGLVHHTDGVAGTNRRLQTAHRHLKAFGIATECGFGRRPPETLSQLLRIHAEVAGVSS